MSSKLHRGGNPTVESISWRRVAGASPPPSTNSADHTRHDLEEQLRRLKLELEERAQAAYRKGLAEGDAVARQQLAGQVGSTVSRLARGIEEISGLRQRFRHEAEAEVVKLALAIARRVLHRELTVDPDALLGIVKSALAKLDSRELHSIRIHPDHAAALQQELQQMGLPARVEVVADPALERGAVILDTTRGALDASVQTQLSEIERGFVDLTR
ncbi:MAG: FliH/SctL family protein [Bryobacteraceae bacterium]